MHGRREAESGAALPVREADLCCAELNWEGLHSKKCVLAYHASALRAGIVTVPYRCSMMLGTPLPGPAFFQGPGGVYPTKWMPP